MTDGYCSKCMGYGCLDKEHPKPGKPHKVGEPMSLTNNGAPYDLSYLIERMRSVTVDVGVSGIQYTHYLEMEAHGERTWVVRYNGLHSVVGNDGLFRAMEEMKNFLASIKIYL